MASVVAEHLGVTRGYVYEHADELGARRLRTALEHASDSGSTSSTSA